MITRSPANPRPLNAPNSTEMQTNTKFVRDLIESTTKSRFQAESYIKISELTPNSKQKDLLLQIEAKLKNTNSQYEDTKFPSQISSIIGNPPLLTTKPHDFNYKWLKPEEFLSKEWTVFTNISPNNIHEGCLSESSLLSALTSLCERPELITRLFDIEERNSLRLYNVWINLNGAWRSFPLSDDFPCQIDPSTSTYLHGSTSSPHPEIWVMLLEKAYAKAYGCYKKIEAGNPIETLRDLTGAPYEIIPGFPLMRESDLDRVWSHLMQSLFKKYLIVCYSMKNDISVSKKSGLIKGHCYSILDVVSVERRSSRVPLRLLKIRNPWGNFEWTGDWSDRSSLWLQHPEVATALKYKSSSDGVFWISLKDFKRCFEGVGICKVEQNYWFNSINYRSRYRSIVQMDVRSLYGPFKTTISVDQQDQRFYEDTTTIGASFLRVTVARLGCNGLKYVATKFSGNRSIFIDLEVQEGRYFILVEPYWKKGVPCPITIGTYGAKQVGLSKIPLSMQVYARMEYQIWKDYVQSGKGGMPSRATAIIPNKESIILPEYRPANQANAVYEFVNNQRDTVTVLAQAIPEPFFDLESQFVGMPTKAKCILDPGETGIFHVKYNPLRGEMKRVNLYVTTRVENFNNRPYNEKFTWNMYNLERNYDDSVGKQQDDAENDAIEPIQAKSEIFYAGSNQLSSIRTGKGQPEPNSHELQQIGGQKIQQSVFSNKMNRRKDKNKAMSKLEENSRKGIVKIETNDEKSATTSNNYQQQQQLQQNQQIQNLSTFQGPLNSSVLWTQSGSRKDLRLKNSNFGAFDDSRANNNNFSGVFNF